MSHEKPSVCLSIFDHLSVSLVLSDCVQSSAIGFQANDPAHTIMAEQANTTRQELRTFI